MKKEPRITAFVPIKRKSERLKNKNFLVLGNRPLYFHILKTLLRVPSINSVYLYTSEPRESFKLPNNIRYLRKERVPSEDNESAILLIQNFCNKIDSDYYLLAHATSPFTKVETIEAAIEQVINGKYDSAHTVEKFNTFAWYNLIPINYELNNIPRTQNIQPINIETSGFYFFEKSLPLNESRRIGYNPYFCEVLFPETIDIDYSWQFQLAEYYMNKKINEII